MPHKRKYTDTQLIESLPRAKYWKDLWADLGLARTSHAGVKSRIKALGLDASHLAKRTYQTKWTREEFEKAVAEGTNYRQVTDALNLGSSAHVTVKKYIKEWNLDTSHWWWNQTDTSHAGAIPLGDILQNGTSYSSARLRKRLVLAGLLKNRCVKCGLGPEWRGEPLTLQLDHINGNPRDNRIDNLRILCPNCHHQTKTWGTKSPSYNKQPKAK